MNVARKDLKKKKNISAVIPNAPPTKSMISS